MTALKMRYSLAQNGADHESDLICDPTPFARTSVGLPDARLKAAELVRRANASCAIEALCRSIAANKECEHPRRELANTILGMLEG